MKTFTISIVAIFFLFSSQFALSQFDNLKKIPTTTPLSSLKFDVEIELDNMKVANIRDADQTEDLYGRIDLFSYKALDIISNRRIGFWLKVSRLANDIHNFRAGTRQIKERESIVQNLSMNELKNLELTIGGSVLDSEFPLPSRTFICQDCSEFEIDKDFGIIERSLGKRIIKFIELASTQNSINNLKNNGEFQLLKFGDDSFFELNYYESGKKEDGWVKFLFKVWIKPHN
jgi:hypothetical protein